MKPMKFDIFGKVCWIVHPRIKIWVIEVDEKGVETGWRVKAKDLVSKKEEIGAVNIFSDCKKPVNSSLCGNPFRRIASLIS